MARVTGRRSDHVVDAAIEVFCEKGYERATVRDIAAKAGVGVSSVYLHAKSKQDLFLQAVRPVIEAGVERMEAIGASDVDEPAKLRRAIVETVEGFESHYPEVFVYLREFFPVLETAAPDLRARYERAWTEIIEQGIRGGVLRAGVDPMAVAYGIIGMCNWMHRWFRPDGRLSATQIGEQFADMVLDGLRCRG